jgi:hypothetical protein
MKLDRPAVSDAGQVIEIGDIDAVRQLVEHLKHQRREISRRHSPYLIGRRSGLWIGIQ